MPVSPSPTITVAAVRAARPSVVRVGRLIGWVLFRTLFRLRLHGVANVPATGPVVLAGNHASFLDGPLVFTVSPRPAFFLVKSELYVGPLARPLRWLGQIPVRRGRPDRSALRAGLGVLGAGEVLGLFPEGTRGSGSFEQLQHGIAYFALRTGCPIVPVVCRGTAEALPKGRRLPGWRAPVHVTFGRPFQVDAVGDRRSRRAVAEAAEQVRRRLAAELSPPP